MLPLVLVSAAVLWSLLIVALVAVCRMAARGDAALAEQLGAERETPAVQAARTATARVADPHPLELLLTDSRERSRSRVTGRAGR